MFCVLLTAWITAAAAEPAFEVEHLSSLSSVHGVVVSPDGAHLAWLLRVPPRPGVDPDGLTPSALYLADAAAAHAGRLYVSHVHAPSEPAFSPDGRYLTFLSSRGRSEGAALWALPVDGGEAREILFRAEGIRSYAIDPAQRRVAVISRPPVPQPLRDARAKGYTQEVFEEELVPNQLWVLDLPPIEPVARTWTLTTAPTPPEPLMIPGSVQRAQWSNDGASLFLTLTPTGTADERYTATQLARVDARTGEVTFSREPAGKLEDWHPSPDGSRLALIAAADPHDPAAGRLLSLDPADGAEVDLLPGLLGHVRAFAWQGNDALLYLADVGVETELGRVTLTGAREVLHRSGGTEDQPLLNELTASGDGATIALTGETPFHPSELYTWSSNGPVRATVSNPWLQDLPLARQQVVQWRARDGLLLEGLLLTPPGEGPHPLLLMVHGGPEAHDHNGWVSNYSRPGQLAASRGFAVLYPNYRGSTGRGVAFSKLSQGDPAGREFDDLLDAVKHLVREGIADPDRVGITGGSYGGYATAWAATRLTEHFRAGVMLVGLSDVLTKSYTTDAPRENLAVHVLTPPWERPAFQLARSPLSWVKDARTPLLIAGGTNDSRVDPSQSLQLFRALELLGQVPVRYVRYPGEGHGNQRAAARDDYTRRLLQWMEHFVRDRKQGLPELLHPLPPAPDAAAAPAQP